MIDVCDRIIDWLPEKYDDLLDQSNRDLGPQSLVGALVIARTARFEAEGVPGDRIVAGILKSGVFEGNQDPTARSRTLLRAVRQSLSGAPLPGAEPWDPAGTEMMLLEFWAAARLHGVCQEQLEREARDVWGVDDARVVKYLSSLPADPLESHTSFLDMANDQDDPAVTGLLVYAVARDAVQNFANRWRVGTPHPDPHHPPEHIIDLKQDMALATAVPRLLAQHVDDPNLDEPTRLSLSRAIHEGHRYRGLLADQLAGLSTFEVRLLEPLAPTEVAVSAALAQILDSSQSTSSDEFSSTGVYGGTPWWSARVSPDNRDTAIALMSSGDTQFFFSHDTAYGLVTIGVQAANGSRDTIVEQGYELENFEDVCMLLLLNRAGAVGVDLVHDNGPTREILHTQHFAIPTALRESIREAAEPALLALLSTIAGNNPDDYVKTRHIVLTTLGSTGSIWRRQTSANYLEVDTPRERVPVKLTKRLRRSINAEDLLVEGGPVVIGVAHDVAMSGDASAFASWLFANVMSDRAALHRNRERIDFAWEGFDQDPRELWEIPEVVAFVTDLNTRWPCALFFMTRHGTGLQVLQFCLLAASAVGSPVDGIGTVRLTGPAIGQLLQQSWFPGLNKVCELAGLGPSEVDELSDSATRYVYEGPR